MAKKMTVPQIIGTKGKQRLSVLTACDYPTAMYAQASGQDMILVGDSLAMVVLGYENTLSITMDEMIHHTRAVTRAAKNTFVIGDMPFLSYQVGVEQAMKNAGRFLQEGGAQAVKLEGGERVLPQVKALVAAGIPVQGHLGLTPQSLMQMGGYKVQGREEEAAKMLIKDAGELERAGCFSIVLEAVPTELAREITDSVSIPTIGIGAGPHCDGQVLVTHDIVGMFERFVPKFVKQYAQVGKDIQDAMEQYKKEVREGSFPGEEHGFGKEKG